MEEGKLPGDWNTVKDKIRQRWDKITAEEVEQINGSRAQLMKRLQDHYELDNEKAKLAVKDFEANLADLGA